MEPLAAYKQAKPVPMTRIDLILTLYRRALANLDQARQAVAGDRPEQVPTLLVGAQAMVMALAAELPAHKDEAATNFLRLYEFVAHQLGQRQLANIDAAAKVLRTLLEGFEAVQDQARALEGQGAIPPLEQTPSLSLTA
jgi:flagellin-specific chaperone FliS